MNDVKLKIVDTNKKLKYSIDEICPCCGTYTADGSVCTNCLKQNDLFEPKVEYIEM